MVAYLSTSGPFRSLDGNGGLSALPALVNSCRLYVVLRRRGGFCVSPSNLPVNVA